ncbi:MAG TPA: VOC family protein [Caulobacteraceae bacterium]|nr:VOC family protein [Caulobacteraceae bacterium]
MNAQTDAKPETVSMKGVIPYIQVEGAIEAVKFYERAFGARELSRFPTEDGKRLMNCQVEINGGAMMLMDAMPEHGFPFQPTHSVTLQLLVDDGQAWFDRAVAAGCTVLTPFQQMFWGDKWGAVIDPYQIRWGIDEPAKS